MAHLRPVANNETLLKQEPADQWIPNINIGQDYDRRYLHATIHYDALDNLAVFFGRDMPVHRHAQYLQIHYIDQGDINFHIDDRLYQVSGPALFLTPPAIPHSFQTSSHASGHVLTIHQSLIWQAMKKGLQQEPTINLSQGICLTESGLDQQQLKQWQLIQQLLQNIHDEWHAEHPAKSLMLENFIEALVIQIARLSGRQAKSVTVNNDDLRLFRQFATQIEQHLCEHWRLSQYTQVIGVSETRLNQLCQRISNSSPKKIIRERLIQEIKRMLIFTSLTANEICYQLGFSDPAYFARFFKTQTGMTPLSFRKRQSRH